MTIPRCVLALVVAALAAGVERAPAGADEAALAFSRSGQPVARRTLAELDGILRRQRIELVDPMYGKTKRYEAFPLRDVLAAVYGPAWADPAFTDIAFTALDGYESVSSLAKLHEGGGYLVVRDLDVSGWEPIGRQRVSPGPFYVVWTGPDQTPEREYPWPWQVASVNVMRFEDQYPAVYPTGAPEGSAALRGYAIFKGRCVRCHSMHGQGGKIGPDLDAPKSIVSYRAPDMIKAFIRRPSEYRHTLMPDHPDLSDAQLDDIVEYFWFKSRQRR